MRPDLYRMFYPLEKSEQDRWAEVVRLPFPEFTARVEEVAKRLGFRQEVRGEALAWTGETGALEMMLFRIPDPGVLSAVQEVYEAVERYDCPIAYVFVNQRGDGVDSWDIFQLSRLSYLCHCNRVSGPGADCEA